MGPHLTRRFWKKKSHEQHQSISTPLQDFKLKSIMQRQKNMWPEFVEDGKQENRGDGGQEETDLKIAQLEENINTITWTPRRLPGEYA
jgi:hypothetical protein